MKPRKLNAGVAERQTRWFQVPVLRDVWVQIPSPAPSKKGRVLGALLFCFIKAVGFEIGRKLLQQFVRRALGLVLSKKCEKFLKSKQILSSGRFHIVF